MNFIKKHHRIIIVVVVVLAIISLLMPERKRHYSLVDFGVAPLVKSDCSSVKNTNAINSPVSVTFNAPNVSLMREKVKSLVSKYNGVITSDSYSSYPSPVPTVSSQDNTYITASFDKSENEFLADLSATVKSLGGVDTAYNYSNINQPQYGSAYSPYASCITLMQNVSADILQLEIFTKALKEEHNIADLFLISQSVSSMKMTLQSDVNNMNSFFSVSDKPSVSININTLQK